MAKDSPKKDSPKKGSPPKEKKASPPGKGGKGGKKESPGKNNKKSSPTKGKGANKSNEEAEKLVAQVFARKRYENMLPIFKRENGLLKLLTNCVHVWETWKELPVICQMFNSNAEMQLDGDKEPEKRCIIEGVVGVDMKYLSLRHKVFIEATATWRYDSFGKKPEPLPPHLRMEHICYRAWKQIFPVDFEEQLISNDFNQQLIKKCRADYGPDFDGHGFSLDLSQCTDSIIFNRPGIHSVYSGVFWKLRAYVAEMECYKPHPQFEVTMDFWKYTYAPLYKVPVENQQEKPKAVVYTRYETPDDVGPLILTVQLDRDLYYFGEQIGVTITIENSSQRHSVQSAYAFIEQTVRNYREIRADYSLQLGEVLLEGSDYGMPIAPKSKNWSKKIELKAEIDFSRYNLVFDGLMSREKRFFLAGSTIILLKEPMTEEEAIEYLKKKEEAKEGGGSKKGSPKKDGSPSKGGKGSPTKKGGSPPKKGGSPPKKAGGKQGNKNNDEINNNAGEKKKSPSPPKKGSPGKGGGKEGSPKKASPGKGDKNAKKTENEKKEEIVIEEVKPVEPPMRIIPTNKHPQRSYHIAYDVVVRLNLGKNGDCNEAGNPGVRVPVVLTRETWMLDKMTIPNAFRPPINFFELPERITSEPIIQVFYPPNENENEEPVVGGSKKGSPKKDGSPNKKGGKKDSPKKGGKDSPKKGGKDSPKKGGSPPKKK